MALNFADGSTLWNIGFWLVFVLMVASMAWLTWLKLPTGFFGRNNREDSEADDKLAALLTMFDGENRFVRNWLQRLRIERVHMELLWQQLEEKMQRYRQDKQMYQLSHTLDNWGEEKGDEKSTAELQAAGEESRLQAREIFELFECLVERFWLTLAEWHASRVYAQASSPEMNGALVREHDCHAAAAHKYRRELDYLRSELDQELLEWSND